MKRAGLILVFTLIISVSAFSSSAFTDSAFSGSPEITGVVEFSDISGHWAEGDIVLLALKEVVFGFSDSTFHPNSPITRLDAAAMLVKLFDAPDSGSQQRLELVVSLPFDDTAALPLEQQRYISEVLKLGLMKGDEGTSSFRPASPISRIEAAVIMVRALGYEGEIRKGSEGEKSVSALKNTFSDIADMPQWAVPYVEKAAGLGLVKGYNDGTFRPMKSITRGEFAVLLNRIDRLIQTQKDGRQYYGRVMAVRTQDRRALHIMLANGKMRSFRVSAEAAFFDETGRVPFENLKEGCEIVFLTDKSGEILYIRIGAAAPEMTVRRTPGRVLSKGSISDYFTLRPHYPMEGERSLRVNILKETIVLAGDKIADFKEIEPNMEVIVVGSVNEYGEIDAREVSVLGPI